MLQTLASKAVICSSLVAALSVDMASLLERQDHQRERPRKQLREGKQLQITNLKRHAFLSESSQLSCPSSLFRVVEAQRSGFQPHTAFKNKLSVPPTTKATISETALKNEVQNLLKVVLASKLRCLEGNGIL